MITSGEDEEEEEMMVRRPRVSNIGATIYQKTMGEEKDGCMVDEETIPYVRPEMVFAHLILVNGGRHGQERILPGSIDWVKCLSFA
ncbi:hypothetical protein Tsubulata_029599 [Turnera subulata]|uniref:Uncharacterized protein n=1 Tax=Turnera subulata TaxID=218843 RepID=A0A9Q0J367_9ROSI|nr:hypothetical protein Tsubulata_029599 [Turnera subulata]